LSSQQNEHFTISKGTEVNSLTNEKSRLNKINLYIFSPKVEDKKTKLFISPNQFSVQAKHDKTDKNTLPYEFLNYSNDAIPKL
jgi:hypothetical protein